MKNRLKISNKPVKHPRLAGVAPPAMLKEDFEALDARVTLRASYDVEQVLLMQSIEGHAHMGHGRFYGKTYPNTSIDDIARALKLDPVAVKRERQALIDEIAEFVDRVVTGERPTVACNTEGEPLLRCGVLRHIEIDPIGLLKGLYIGGLRDDAEIRDAANRRYGMNIGYGKCFLVDQRVLHDLGLDGFELARRGHERDMERFEEAGLFRHNGDPNVAYMYVRFQEGPGASDDAAIVMAGMMHGFSAAIGCFFADAVDTLEKYVPEYSDQDSDISSYIQEQFPNLGVTVDDAVDLAYLCAIPREMQGHVPDSSLRHLLEIDRMTDQCAVESHLAYIANRPYSPMDLDHGECTNIEFYSYVERKLKKFEKVRD